MRSTELKRRADRVDVAVHNLRCDAVVDAVAKILSGNTERPRATQEVFDRIHTSVTGLAGTYRGNDTVATFLFGIWLVEPGIAKDAALMVGIDPEAIGEMPRERA